MKTTHSKSVVSDLILACFILSVFLLLENRKENVNSALPAEMSLESQLEAAPHNLKANDRQNSISYILE